MHKMTKRGDAFFVAIPQHTATTQQLEFVYFLINAQLAVWETLQQTCVLTCALPPKELLQMT